MRNILGDDMDEQKPTMPNIRTVASPGRVHFGLSQYAFQKPEEIMLTYETSPARARELAAVLREAANQADAMGDAFPQLAPPDAVKAIPAVAAVHDLDGLPPLEEPIEAGEEHDW